MIHLLYNLHEDQYHTLRLGAAYFNMLIHYHNSAAVIHSVIHSYAHAMQQRLSFPNFRKPWFGVRPVNDNFNMYL